MRLSTLPKVAAVLGLAGLALLLALPAADRASAPQPEPPIRAVSSHTYRVPLYFEPAPGSAAQEERFVARGLRYGLAADQTGLLLRLADAGTADVRIRFAGARPAVAPEGVDRRGSFTSYFRGRSADDWIRRSPHFGRLRYTGLYPGIDAEVYGNARRALEFDYVVHPGADPGAIRLAFEGVDALSITADGDLAFRAGDERFVLQAPTLYQTVDGAHSPVDGRYVLTDARMVGFDVGAYDHGRPLVIDPVLVYTTFLSGSNGETARAVAVDQDGNAYIVGITNSTDFPTTPDPIQTDADGTGNDVFVSKFDPTGALLFSTYLGGTEAETTPCGTQTGIDVDADGNLWIVGSTTSADFPVKNPIQETITPTPDRNFPRADIFITQVAAAGDALLFSTYYGGEDTDWGCGIDVDPESNVYFSGSTRSENFPVVNPLQPKTGRWDAVVAKMAADRSIVYSTYLGGAEASGDEHATDIAVGPDGAAYVAGQSTAPGFPLVNADQPAPGGGTSDGFVARINPAGDGIDFATFLGGSNPDEVYGIAFDAVNDQVVVVGITNSKDFPTGGGPADFAPPADLEAFAATNGFVTVYSPAGERLWASYLGGDGQDIAYDVTTGANGHAYVVGRTRSTDFPLADAFQDAFAGGIEDAFVTEIDLAGKAPVFSTYLGGSGADTGYGVAVDAGGNLLVAGQTGSDDFPTGATGHSEVRGSTAAFVAKFGSASAPGLSVTPNPVQFPVTPPGQTSTVAVTVTSTGTAPVEIQNVTVEPLTVFALPDPPALPATLDPGATLVLEVAYSPTLGPAKTAGVADDEGALTVVNNSATPIVAVPLRAGGLVVNDAGDGSDASADDGVCDADLNAAGNQCTLRAAIEIVNAAEREDVTPIAFAIPGDGPPVIRPESALPPIRYPAALDATTQPGSRMVELKGPCPCDENEEWIGLTVEGGNSLVKGFHIGGFKIGVALASHPGSIIENCEIRNNSTSGIDIDDVPNMNKYHKIIQNTIYNNTEVGIIHYSISEDERRPPGRIVIENNTIGSISGVQKTGVHLRFVAEDTLRNNVIIHNNMRGIFLHASSLNFIEDNHIGTNRLGDQNLGNGTGLFLFNAIDNRVRRNTVSGNTEDGILLNAASRDNRIENNKIGTDQIGLFRMLGNGGFGIRIMGSKDNTVDNNVISNNGGGGIFISKSEGNRITDNDIGTNLGGDTKMPNKGDGVVIEGFGRDCLGTIEPNEIRRNVISGNQRSGILLDKANCTPFILRNRIGVDASGRRALANELHGITIRNGIRASIRDNVISGNARNGIAVTGGYAGDNVHKDVILLVANRIGTDVDGLQPIGNEQDGVFVDNDAATRMLLSGNVISANGRNGLHLNKTRPRFRLELLNNKIGSDLQYRDPLGVMGNGENGILLFENETGLSKFHDPDISIEKNFIAFNQANGVFFSRTSGGFTFTRNTIAHNVVGARLEEAAAFTIQCNAFRNNRSHIIVDDDTRIDDVSAYECNELADASDTNTGIHLRNASGVRIRGNQLTGDAGHAIVVENGTDVRVTGNNIFGNQGLGLDNRTPANLVAAADNWWGQPDGPSGDGPGSGDAVSGGVDFTGWRAAPASVIAVPARESVALPLGETDTAEVYVQNWVDRDDTIQLSIFDSQGWFDGFNAFEVKLTDSLAARVVLPFTLPPNAGDGTESTVTFIATSRTNPDHSDETTFTVRALEPALSAFVVAPDSVTLAPGDTALFVATGFDQLGRTFETDVAWSATGGAINADGIYVAGAETGVFEVSATAGGGAFSGGAVVTIDLTPTGVETPPAVPRTLALHAAYPNPFRASATFRFDLPAPTRVRLEIFDVLGRRVRVLVDREQRAGRHTAVWNGRTDTGAQTSSGIYLYRLRAGEAIRTLKLVRVR